MEISIWGILWVGSTLILEERQLSLREANDMLRDTQLVGTNPRLEFTIHAFFSVGSSGAYGTC